MKKRARKREKIETRENKIKMPQYTLWLKAIKRKDINAWELRNLDFTMNKIINVYSFFLLLFFGRYRLMIEIRFIYFYWIIFFLWKLFDFFRFSNIFFLVNSHLNHIYTCTRTVAMRCHYLQNVICSLQSFVRRCAVEDHRNRQQVARKELVYFGW